MSDEKYIKSLFESARSESPKLSFEETSKTFEESLRPGIAETLKDWFFNHIYLNSFIMITAALIIATAFWTTTSDTVPIEITEVQHKITETKLMGSKDSLVPITVTVETPNETVEISFKGEPENVRIETIEAPAPVVEPTKSDITINGSDNISEKPDTLVKEEQSSKISSISDLKKPKNKKRASITSNPKSNRLKTLKKSGTRKMSELEKVIGLSLNTEGLDHIFNWNKYTGYEQLTMIANGVFDHTVEVRHRGKQVIIAPNIQGAGFRPLGKFIDAKELRISDNNSYFKFFYGKNIVEVYLKKANNIWQLDKLSIDKERDEISLEENLIQKALDSEYLKEVFIKDEYGNYPPLVIYTNGHFSKGVDLSFEQQRITVFFNQIQSKRVESNPVIYITKFKIKRRKAILGFKYKNSEISVELKKKNKIWEMKSLRHKEEGKVYSHLRY